MDSGATLDRDWLAEDIECRAWRDMHEAVPERLAHRLGLGLEQFRGITLTTCLAYDDGLANRAFGPGLLEPLADDTIGRLVGHFRSRGLRNFALQMKAGSRVSGHGSWLTQHRLERRNGWVILCHEDEAPPEIDVPFRVDEITHEGAASFADTAGAGFGWPKPRAAWMSATVGRPGWHHYIDSTGRNTMGCGALYVSGRVGWLGMATTRARYRRRGVQTALLHRRIRDARALGCRSIFAQTGETNPSYNNLLRAGFLLVHVRDNFSEPVPDAVAPSRWRQMFSPEVVR